MSSRVITETVRPPLAGADFSFRISQTDKVLLLTLSAVLTTSVAVANRRPALSFADQSAGVFWSADAINPQAASLGVTYSWARGLNVGAAAAIVTSERVGIGLPWVRLQPNDTLASITSGLDAADQWSSIVYRAIVGDWWDEEAELSHLAQAFAIAAAG